MKAYIITGKESGEVKEISTPIPGDDEVLVKVQVSGLCGTDIHIYKGEYFSSYPLIPGHEFSGEIVTVGKNVKHFRPGDRVAADPNIFCERCFYCKQNKQNFCSDFQAAGVTRNGSFAEYLVIPESSCFAIDEIPFDQAALLEPLACVIHGHNVAAMRNPSRVLIFGVGPIGLMHVQMSRLIGAGEVHAVDLKDERLAIAKLMGADYIYKSDNDIYADLSARFPQGFDMVIDTTGVASVIEKEFTLLAPTGTLLVFGVTPETSTISINPYEIFRKEIRIIGSFALKKTFGTAVELVKSKRIDVSMLIGAQISLEMLPEYMDLMMKGETELKTQVVFQR